jgi:hypothetical protein
MSMDAGHRQVSADELSDVPYDDYVRGFNGLDGGSCEHLAPSKERWLVLRLLPLLAHLSPDAVIHEVGFGDILLRETGPVPNGLLGMLRVLLWNVARSVGRLAIMAESGRKPTVLTQEILCSGRKVAAH